MALNIYLDFTYSMICCQTACAMFVLTTKMTCNMIYEPILITWDDLAWGLLHLTVSMLTAAALLGMCFMLALVTIIPNKVNNVFTSESNDRARYLDV